MKRSKFSLSNYRLLTMDQGTLVPIGITEVLPGDTIQQSTSALIRVSPLAAPVMHPVGARIHHWFVPHRLVWEDFEDFITGGEDGMDASVLPTLQLDTPNSDIGSLADYFGIPCPEIEFSSSQQRVSALPFRAYALIFNEFYRDQDLQNKLIINKASGIDITTNKTLQTVAWEKDYFTTARPWTQKGPVVTLPLGDTAPIQRVDNASQWKATIAGTNGVAASFTGLTSDASGFLEADAGATPIAFDPDGQIEVDLSTATAATVNQVRLAFALQRFEEARARYGARYTEYLRYCGVRSSDARLQRPEYLGGGKQTVQFSEVLQTTPNPNEVSGLGGLGSMGGHGIGALRSNRYRRFFEEHGYIISVMSVKPKTMYTQGLARHWSRTSKTDFFTKELEGIGQQEVINKELFVGTTLNDAVFGYQDRYDEYRRMESGVSGDFRSTLDYWHMARIFASRPTLNADFISANPTTRVYVDTVSQPLWCMVNHSIQARRIVGKGGPSYEL